MKYFIIILTIISTILFSANADHLLLTGVSVRPLEAQMFIITNPTTSNIDLTDYYITDATKNSDGNFYYKLPSGVSYWSESFLDFFTRFPAISLAPGDSLTVALTDSTIFNNYYEYDADLVLEDDFLNGSPDGSDTIGPLARLDEDNECLILFYWDGISSTVLDVDYFIWGDNSHASAKTTADGYPYNDTPVDQQQFMRTYLNSDLIDSLYRRVDIEEDLEHQIDGNGITGHDETSEDLPSSWEIVPLYEIVPGCMDEIAINYNPEADFDDGSCTYVEGCTDEDAINFDAEVVIDIGSCIYADDIVDIQLIHAGLYDNETVTVIGVMVDYFDVTVYNGPHSLTLEDANGYRIEISIWPSDWDIPNSPQAHLITPPFKKYLIGATGVVGEWEGEKQIGVSGPVHFVVLDFLDPDGDFVADPSITKAKISPTPFVVIPTLGEVIEYSYEYPADSRVVIRIFDLAGRFVTTLRDDYVGSQAGIQGVNEKPVWDGRDHLGGIVAPGTYIIHLEASNFQTGKTTTDTAPIVVGVRF
jgi:hypothetical protein